MAEEGLLESRYKVTDMAKFKPTLKDPMSDQSKDFEKNFKKTMKQNQIQFTEEKDFQFGKNGITGIQRPKINIGL